MTRLKEESNVGGSYQIPQRKKQKITKRERFAMDAENSSVKGKDALRNLICSILKEQDRRYEVFLGMINKLEYRLDAVDLSLEGQNIRGR